MSEQLFTFHIPHSHPSLSGHFPGNPVVPGVIILEQVLLKWKAFSHKKIIGVDYSKFMTILAPEVDCNINFKATKSASKTDFIITNSDNMTIAKGRLIHEQ